MNCSSPEKTDFIMFTVGLRSLIVSRSIICHRSAIIYSGSDKKEIVKLTPKTENTSFLKTL
jgi:hypothetical protein